jgi:sigma-B regulation protein RsbU (phosphoserine phosphatase)
MAVTKTLIKSRAANDLSPASILSHVNTELSRHNDACMFVTIFLAILDLESGRMVYTNAGHNPPYIKRTTGDLVRLDSRHGPILGAKTGLAYGEDRVQLQPDDLVFLYTDGVTEAMNAPEELYTEARLRGLLESSRLDSVEEAVRVMVDDVWDYQGDAEQADDVTVLAASWLGQEDVGEHRLQLTVANQPEEIDRVNEAFTAFAGSHDLPKEVRRKMSLVFDELLNNIISYAYEDEGEHLIEVTASVLGRRLVVTLTDDGRAFNPFDQEAPDTGVSLHDREIGGLGVHLVKSLMDSVVYERRGMKSESASRENRMNLETKTVGAVSLVQCDGKLDTNTSTEAQEYLVRLIEGGASKILIDFGKVDFVSSAGLRVLLATAKRLSGSGGSLRVCGLNETVNEVFEFSGFSTILSVFPSEAEALEGF